MKIIRSFIPILIAMLITGCEPSTAGTQEQALTSRSSPTPTIRPAEIAQSVEAPVPTNTTSLPDISAPEEDRKPTADGLISPDNAAQIEILHILQGHGGQIVDFTFSLDDKQIISVGGDCSLKHWDTLTGEEAQSLKFNCGPIYNGAISPGGSLFSVEGDNHKILLVNTGDGQIVREMSGHTSSIMSLMFSADGRYLATGDSIGSIRVWETETGQLIHTLAGHPSSIGALAFSPDNTLLASGGVEGTYDIKIWDLANGEETASFTGHTANVYDLEFSPGGTTLASTSGDRTVRLWDPGTGEAYMTFRGHRSNVYSVDFSPDGRLLASSDFDGHIKLWNMASGTELKDLKGHGDLVEPVRFSNDGCLLASGSFDSTIIIWGISGGICSSPA